jgi:hypothetical protein
VARPQPRQHHHRALGGQRFGCDGCGAEQWRWHACRNRHCPQGQAQAREAWRAERMSECLDLPCCHLVFTLPHALNVLAAVHARWRATRLCCSAPDPSKQRDPVTFNPDA